MAYASCAAEVAANIVQSCESPNVGGYTGRAVYIPKLTAPTIVRAAGNPRIVTGITLGSGVKTVAIDNVMTTPFDGSSTELSTDNGWGSFVKNIVVRIPLRGGAASKEVVEPLLRSAQGGILVLEKRDARGDGSFEIVGLEAGVKASALTRNENENGGDWSATLSCNEYYAESVLFDTDYETTLAKFEALLAQSY